MQKISHRCLIILRVLGYIEIDSNYKDSQYIIQTHAKAWGIVYQEYSFIRTWEKLFYNVISKEIIIFKRFS